MRAAGRGGGEGWVLSAPLPQAPAAKPQGPLVNFPLQWATVLRVAFGGRETWVLTVLFLAMHPWARIPPLLFPHQKHRDKQWHRPLRGDKTLTVSPTVTPMAAASNLKRKGGGSFPFLCGALCGGNKKKVPGLARNQDPRTEWSF